MIRSFKEINIRYADAIPTSILEELEIFRSSLEKCYFSNVLLRILKSSDDCIQIGVEIQSNFEFSESITYYNNSTKLDLFFSAVEKLRKNSSICIDIEELAIYMLDTALIINNVSKNSIVQQLELILSSVVTNMGNLRAYNLELPYEIHLPLYEDEDAVILKNNNIEKSYFRFWGLYYESEEDAVIYDVNNETIFKGDLLMVNHIEIMENR